MSDTTRAILLTAALSFAGFVLVEILFSIRDLELGRSESKKYIDRIIDIEQTQEEFRNRIRANEQNLLKCKQEVMKTRKKIQFDSIVESK